MIDPVTPDDCRRRRTELGLSLGGLASLAGLAERTVWQFEAGRVAPRQGTLIALRKAFRAAEQFARPRLLNEEA